MPGHNAAFPRSVRLLTAADYRRVFQQPVKLSERCCSVRFRDNGLGYARLGLAISRKTVRRAVDRNRIKRLIRESFRQNQRLLDSFDIVVLSANTAAGVSNREFRDTLARVWRKIGEGR